MNAERAWIMPELKWGIKSGLLRFVDKSGSIHTNASIDLFWQNDGKTPAWISEVVIKLEVTSAGPAAQPDMTGGEVLYGPFPVVPGPRPFSAGKRFVLSGEGWAGTGKMTLIYGLVKYRDIFTPKDKIWESWFGYRVVGISGLERIAHSEYNKNA
jgi:hypothetical protein